jgi:hypothetical protein
LFGNLGELLRQLFERDILLADNAQYRDGCALHDSELAAEIRDLVRVAGRRSFYQILHLLGGKPIGDGHIATGGYRRALIALRLDPLRLGRDRECQRRKSQEQDGALGDPPSYPVAVWYGCDVRG